ncbi:hypothetical protein FRC12_016621 [Ceratobasidium sp. 428]|nr:hypothetical protein FRC12_016621 [Ceratobasidium sp. 428]
MPSRTHLALFPCNRPQAATATINRWAWRHVTQLSRAELDSLALDAKLNDPGSDLDNIPDVENIKFEALSDQTTRLTPNLVRFLTLVGETKPRARARRRAGAFGAETVVPSFAAVMNVYSLAFQLAPRCNKLQKHFSLYFRAKRAPKSLFVLFNKCGYTASYPWSTAAVKTLSEQALLKMKEAVQNHAVFWIYDNLRLPTPIKAQRGDRHTVTNNGTAMTVVQLPDSVKHVFFKEVPDTPTEPIDPNPLEPVPSSAKPPFPREHSRARAGSGSSRAPVQVVASTREHYYRPSDVLTSPSMGARKCSGVQL